MWEPGWNGGTAQAVNSPLISLSACPPEESQMAARLISVVKATEQSGQDENKKKKAKMGMVKKFSFPYQSGRQDPIVGAIGRSSRGLKF